ncbi:MAG: hypothetical protein EPN79_11970 [Burkholderiaceae bacterium]|nr:MAG: hypothetical protein EPN79_11970 [Burkholderiaceae bacterium]TBR76859.1 MAG: hypothetical protein EPN64_06460 [Burkholderiaceae bacterium]
MTVKKAKFRLQLARQKKVVKHVGLSFNVSDPGGWFINPVVSEACGETMDYGKLFAYLFRRFGYPNFGWDGYKELTKYILTTPHKDLFLCVVPFVGDSTDLHFSFLTPFDVYLAAENYGQRFRHAWEMRAFDWQEQRGLPHWMPGWLNFCTSASRESCADAPEYTNWRDTTKWMFLPGGPSDPHYELRKKASEFFKALYADYEAVERRPGYVERATDWREWDDADPLKSFAEAGFAALQDLRRPVRVRDAAIDAFGEVKESRAMKSLDTVNEAPASGYPSGNLGNVATKEFADLHGLIMKMGKGNARRGIAKMMALAQQS